MGQRLNLGIRKKGKILANAYYHWSAYTGSSYELSAKAHEYLVAHPNESDLLKAIHALEATGAGLEPEEFIYAGSRRDLCNKEFNKATDRNEGLLAISPRGIQDTEDWAEGTVYIDIDDPECPMYHFWVVWMDDQDVYEEEYCDDDTPSYKTYTFDPEEPMDFSTLTSYCVDLYSGKAILYNGRVFRELA